MNVQPDWLICLFCIFNDLNTSIWERMQNNFQWQIKSPMQNIDLWKNTIYIECDDVLHNLTIISEVGDDLNFAHLHPALSFGCEGIATHRYLGALYIIHRLFQRGNIRMVISSLKRLGLEGRSEISHQIPLCMFKIWITFMYKLLENIKDKSKW